MKELSGIVALDHIAKLLVMLLREADDLVGFWAANRCLRVKSAILFTLSGFVKLKNLHIACLVQTQVYQSGRLNLQPQKVPKLLVNLRQ